jgi:galactose mutarotase-like enzyme
MSSRFSIDRTPHGGYEGCRVSDSAAGLAAVFLPAVGMVGASLTHDGQELLGRTGDLERCATQGSTMGVPLLHPWANRLGGFAYAAGGREVALEPMTAPTNALASGDGLRLVEPGASFSAAFRIAVERCS